MVDVALVGNMTLGSLNPETGMIFILLPLYQIIRRFTNNVSQNPFYGAVRTPPKIDLRRQSKNDRLLKSIYRGGTLKECSPKRTKWLLWMLAVRVLPSRYELVMNHYGCWLYDLGWNIY